MATNVPTTFFVVGDNNDGDLTGFLDLVNQFLAADTPPTTFTTSFGFPEALVPTDLAKYVDPDWEASYIVLMFPQQHL